MIDECLGNAFGLRVIQEDEKSTIDLWSHVVILGTLQLFQPDSVGE
jgi:hypothetical protein